MGIPVRVGQRGDLERLGQLGGVQPHPDAHDVFFTGIEPVDGGDRPVAQGGHLGDGFIQRGVGFAATGGIEPVLPRERVIGKTPLHVAAGRLLVEPEQARPVDLELGDEMQGQTARDGVLQGCAEVDGELCREQHGTIVR